MEEFKRTFGVLFCESQGRIDALHRDPERAERAILALCDLCKLVEQSPECGVTAEEIADGLALVLIGAVNVAPGPRPKGDA